MITGWKRRQRRNDSSMEHFTISNSHASQACRGVDGKQSAYSTTHWKTAEAGPTGRKVHTLSDDGKWPFGELELAASVVTPIPHWADPEDVPVSDGELLHDKDTLTCAAFTSDGTRLVTASQSGTLYVWNIADRKLLHRFSEAAPQAISIVDISLDGRLVMGAVGSSRYCLELGRRTTHCRATRPQG